MFDTTHYHRNIMEVLEQSDKVSKWGYRKEETQPC